MDTPDPLDIVPDATEIRRRLGETYRTARILRGLLKISERRQEHDQLTKPKREVTSCN